MKQILKIILTISLLWLVLRQVDIETALELYISADHALLIVATVLLVLLLVPASLRWRYVLRTFELSFPFMLLLQWNLAASFFNNILPTGIGGDVMRTAWCRRAGLPVASALESVVIDRLAAFVSLLLLVFVSLPFAAPFMDISGAQLLLWPVGALVVLAGGLGVLILLEQLQLKSTQYLGAILRRAETGMVNPALLAKILASGVATHVIRVLGIWLIARALHIDITLTASLVLFPVALLLAMIPVTIGGWGLREGVFVVVLSQVHVSAVAAATLSVVYGLANLVTSLPGAVVWLHLGSNGGIDRK